MEKIAIGLKIIESRGHARLYRMIPPLPDSDGKAYEYIIVSAAEIPGVGPETYIFPARAAASEPVSYSEMSGSQRGTLSHEQVLKDLGYRIA